MSYKINVYKIWWDGKDDLYVGSTRQRLCTRMTEHRRNCKKGIQYKIYGAMRINGYRFSYVLLESYEVSCKDEQLKYEQRHLDLLHPNLNKNRAYNTPEDSKRMQKCYRDTHKDKLRVIHKQYRETHKDEAKQYRKQYYESNKEELSIKYKQYREDNKNKINTYRKQYGKDYKDKIKAQRKQHYKTNREKISKNRRNAIVECDCGITIRKSSILRHMRTQKHKKNLQRVNLYYLNLLPFQ